MYSEDLELEPAGPWLSYEEFSSESVSPEEMLRFYRVPGPGSFHMLMPPPPVLPGDSGTSGGCRLHSGQPAGTCSVIKVNQNPRTKKNFGRLFEHHGECKSIIRPDSIEGQVRLVRF